MANWVKLVLVRIGALCFGARLAEWHGWNRWNNKNQDYLYRRGAEKNLCASAVKVYYFLQFPLVFRICL